MYGHYLFPKARKYILLALITAVLVLAWPLPLLRYVTLCFCLSAYLLLKK